MISEFLSLVDTDPNLTKRTISNPSTEEIMIALIYEFVLSYKRFWTSLNVGRDSTVVHTTRISLLSNLANNDDAFNHVLTIMKAKMVDSKINQHCDSLQLLPEDVVTFEGGKLNVNPTFASRLLTLIANSSMQAVREIAEYNLKLDKFSNIMPDYISDLLYKCADEQKVVPDNVKLYLSMMSNERLTTILTQKTAKPDVIADELSIYSSQCDSLLTDLAQCINQYWLPNDELDFGNISLEECYDASVPVITRITRYPGLESSLFAVDALVSGTKKGSVIKYATKVIEPSRARYRRCEVRDVVSKALSGQGYSGSQTSRLGLVINGSWDDFRLRAINGSRTLTISYDNITGLASASLVTSRTTILPPLVGQAYRTVGLGNDRRASKSTNFEVQLIDPETASLEDLIFSVPNRIGLHTTSDEELRGIYLNRIDTLEASVSTSVTKDCVYDRGQRRSLVTPTIAAMIKSLFPKNSIGQTVADASTVVIPSFVDEQKFVNPMPSDITVPRYFDMYFNVNPSMVNEVVIQRLSEKQGFYSGLQLDGVPLLSIYENIEQLKLDLSLEDTSKLNLSDSGLVVRIHLDLYTNFKLPSDAIIDDEAQTLTLKYLYKEPELSKAILNRSISLWSPSGFVGTSVFKDVSCLRWNNEASLAANLWNAALEYAYAIQYVTLSKLLMKGVGQYIDINVCQSEIMRICDFFANQYDVTRVTTNYFGSTLALPLDVALVLLYSITSVIGKTKVMVSDNLSEIRSHLKFKDEKSLSPIQRVFLSALKSDVRFTVSNVLLDKLIDDNLQFDGDSSKLFSKEMSIADYNRTLALQLDDRDLTPAGDIFRVPSLIGKEFSGFVDSVINHPNGSCYLEKPIVIGEFIRESNLLAAFPAEFVSFFSRMIFNFINRVYSVTNE